MVIPAIAENSGKIRATVIPHVETWAKTNTAVFNFQKTAFTHFTHTVGKVNNLEVSKPLAILVALVVSLSQVKIFGLLLDQKLNYRAYIT